MKDVMSMLGRLDNMHMDLCAVICFPAKEYVLLVQYRECVGSEVESELPTTAEVDIVLTFSSRLLIAMPTSVAAGS